MRANNEYLDYEKFHHGISPIHAGISQVHDALEVDLFRAAFMNNFELNMYDRGHLIYSIVRVFKSIKWPEDLTEDDLRLCSFAKNQYEIDIAHLLFRLYDKDYLKEYYRLAVEENKREISK